MDNQQLSLDLIEAQYNLKNSIKNKDSKSLLIVIGGIELTKKNQSIKKLSELMDPRYLKIKAEIPNKIQPNKIIWQPYVNDIPKNGQIMVLYSNWYTDLLASTILEDGKISKNEFKKRLEDIYVFEDYLKNNNVDIIKVWFDVSWEKVKQRTQKIDFSKFIQRVPHLVWDDVPLNKWKTKTLYNQIQILRQGFTQDWVMIDSENDLERNLQFSQLILAHLKQAPIEPKNTSTYQPAPILPALTQIQKSEISQDEYKKIIKQLEKKIADALRYSSHNVILVFEGMDAAGKGSSIKRIIKFMGLHEYNIHSISAPENFERLRPYLWRFWNKHSNNGALNIFDRSWYGRVLVERVEDLISPTQWQNAYAEINQYEKQLSDTNTIVIKFWLAISKEEQLHRFNQRKNTPQKSFKLTEEDWRNREKWDAYLQAASDMFKYTSTDLAPWHIIANDRKYAARIEILQIILKNVQAKNLEHLKILE